MYSYHDESVVSARRVCSSPSNSASASPGIACHPQQHGLRKKSEESVAMGIGERGIPRTRRSRLRMSEVGDDRRGRAGPNTASPSRSLASEKNGRSAITNGTNGNDFVGTLSSLVTEEQAGLKRLAAEIQSIPSSPNPSSMSDRKFSSSPAFFSYISTSQRSIDSQSSKVTNCSQQSVFYRLYHSTSSCSGCKEHHDRLQNLAEKKRKVIAAREAKAKARAVGITQQREAKAREARKEAELGKARVLQHKKEREEHAQKRAANAERQRLHQLRKVRDDDSRRRHAAEMKRERLRKCSEKIRTVQAKQQATRQNESGSVVSVQAIENPAADETGGNLGNLLHEVITIGQQPITSRCHLTRENESEPTQNGHISPTSTVTTTSTTTADFFPTSEARSAAGTPRRSSESKTTTSAKASRGNVKVFDRLYAQSSRSRIIELPLAKGKKVSTQISHRRIEAHTRVRKMSMVNNPPVRIGKSRILQDVPGAMSETVHDSRIRRRLDESTAQHISPHVKPAEYILCSPDLITDKRSAAERTPRTKNCHQKSKRNTTSFDNDSQAEGINMNNSCAPLHTQNSTMDFRFYLANWTRESYDRYEDEKKSNDDFVAAEAKCKSTVSNWNEQVSLEAGRRQSWKLDVSAKDADHWKVEEACCLQSGPLRSHAVTKPFSDEEGGSDVEGSAADNGRFTSICGILYHKENCRRNEKEKFLVSNNRTDVLDDVASRLLACHISQDNIWTRKLPTLICMLTNDQRRRVRQSAVENAALQIQRVWRGYHILLAIATASVQDAVSTIHRTCRFYLKKRQNVSKKIGSHAKGGLHWSKRLTSAERHSTAIKIQRLLRRFLTLRLHRSTSFAAFRVQKCWSRRWNVIQRQRTYKSAIISQSYIRRKRSQPAFVDARKKVVLLQALFRRYLEMMKFLNIRKNLIYSQPCISGVFVGKSVLGTQNAMCHTNNQCRDQGIEIFHEAKEGELKMDTGTSRKVAHVHGSDSVMSSIRIQSVVRLFQTTKKITVLADSAGKIQIRWRMHLMRKNFFDFLHDMYSFRCGGKTFTRGEQLQRAFNFKHEKQSAIRIQTLWRSRLHVRESRKLQTACLAVQRFFRIFSARKQVTRQRLRSASLIFGTWRMYKTTVAYKLMRLGFLKLQTLQRIRFRLHETERRKASVALQCFWRFVMSREKLRRHSSVQLIQASWRTFQARNAFVSAVVDICRLQKFVRRCLQMTGRCSTYQECSVPNCWLMTRGSFALGLQNHHEARLIPHRVQWAVNGLKNRYHQRSKVEESHLPAQIIQYSFVLFLTWKRSGGVGRMFTCCYRIRHQRLSILRTRTFAATTLQSTCRMFFSRNAFEHLRCAAIVIQKALRLTMHVGCDNLNPRKNSTNAPPVDVAVVKLQSTTRMRLHHGTFQKKREAAKKIQICFFARKRKLSVTKAKSSAIVLQTIVRKHRAQEYVSLIKRDCEAACAIQACVRAFHASKHESADSVSKSSSSEEFYNSYSVEFETFTPIKTRRYSFESMPDTFSESEGEKSSLESSKGARPTVLKSTIMESQSADYMRDVALLQTHWRRCNKTRRYNRAIQAVTKLQGVARGAYFRKCPVDRRYNFGVLLAKPLGVQSFSAGRHQNPSEFKTNFRKRAIVKLLVNRENMAALKISMAWKSAIRRTGLTHLNNYAITLQSQCRRYSRKLQFDYLRRCSVIVQSLLRMHLVLNKKQLEYFCARKIQQMSRCHLLRNDRRQKTIVIVKLQSSIRSKKKRKTFLFQRMSARHIQKIFRSWCDRRAINAYMREIFKLQIFIRLLLRRRREVNAAIAVQSFVKQHRCRYVIHLQREKSVVIQKHLRKRLRYRSMTRKREAAKSIQKVWRNVVQCIRIEKVRKDAEMVASKSALQEMVLLLSVRGLAERDVKEICSNFASSSVQVLDPSVQSVAACLVFAEQLRCATFLKRNELGEKKDSNSSRALSVFDSFKGSASGDAFESKMSPATARAVVNTRSSTPAGDGNILIPTKPTTRSIPPLAHSHCRTTKLVNGKRKTVGEPGKGGVLNIDFLINKKRNGCAIDDRKCGGVDGVKKKDSWIPIKSQMINIRQEIVEPNKETQVVRSGRNAMMFIKPARRAKSACVCKTRELSAKTNERKSGNGCLVSQLNAYGVENGNHSPFNDVMRAPSNANDTLLEVRHLHAFASDASHLKESWNWMENW